MDSPGLVGVGLKLLTDVHTVVAGLIDCVFSLKGDAACWPSWQKKAELNLKMLLFLHRFHLYGNMWACFIYYTAHVRFSRMY